MAQDPRGVAHSTLGVGATLKVGMYHGGRGDHKVGRGLPAKGGSLSALALPTTPPKVGEFPCPPPLISAF